MKLQVLKNGEGKDTGIFIPIEDWTLIKTNYPDIDNLDQDIPDWQKQLIDRRLNDIAENPQTIRPIEELFKDLDIDK